MGDKMIRYAAHEGLRYALLWGRDTPIVYRPDKFELVDSDFSLFPDEFPGHEGIFNNGQTKSWTLGVFRVKENGKLLIFVSTHLWYKSGNPASKSYQPYSDEARAYQLGIVMDKVEEYQKKYNCPAVVVGDLNANYNSLAVQSALSRGYKHGHDIAVEYADESMGYHYCFPAGFETKYRTDPFPAAIDHILVKDADEGFVRRFERFSPEYYYPLSDHSPAFIDVEI
ncbi:MAG: endonuclease/exonuclease/phosphatase family protein [Clostridia bacterium]|nr:endonuclease/exonuclease/phosphatase family protein [Clostridia bacterium]